MIDIELLECALHTLPLESRFNAGEIESLIRNWKKYLEKTSKTNPILPIIPRQWTIYQWVWYLSRGAAMRIFEKTSTGDYRFTEERRGINMITMQISEKTFEMVLEEMTKEIPLEISKSEILLHAGKKTIRAKIEEVKQDGNKAKLVIRPVSAHQNLYVKYFSNEDE